MKNKLKLFIIGSSLFSIAMLIGGCGTETETTKGAAGEVSETQKDSINNPDESIFMIGGTNIFYSLSCTNSFSN